MKSLLLAFAFAGGCLLTACGGGDKKAAGPTERPAATAESDQPKATATARATATAVEPEPTEHASGKTSDGVGTVSSVFSSLFQTGTGGGAGMRGLGDGDESLKAYLPADSDFPDGYMSVGAMTFSSPAGDLGAIDMAMTMAMKGDPDMFTGGDPSGIDLSSIEMIMAAVMKPEDLQALGDALSQMEGLTTEDIQEEMDTVLGDMEGFEVQRFEVLDASGLGEGGFGMEMTVDLSGLDELIGAFGGGEDAPEIGSMTMRMYVFGRGDYMAAVMRFGFSDSLTSDGADLDLAGIMDAKLASAP